MMISCNAESPFFRVRAGFGRFYLGILSWNSEKIDLLCSDEDGVDSAPRDFATKSPSSTVHWLYIAYVESALAIFPNTM